MFNFAHKGDFSKPEYLSLVKVYRLISYFNGHIASVKWLHIYKQKSELETGWLYSCIHRGLSVRRDDIGNYRETKLITETSYDSPLSESFRDLEEYAIDWIHEECIDDGGATTYRVVEAQRRKV